MAVRICMISVVVPISRINAVCSPGGFSGFRARHQILFEKFGCYDEHLLACVHDDPEIVGMDVEAWERRGLKAVESGRWIDMCVVDQHTGPTLPCDWLEFDPESRCAWMKGTEKGEIVVPGIAELADQAVFIPTKVLEQAEVKIVSRRPWWKFWRS